MKRTLAFSTATALVGITFTTGFSPARDISPYCGKTFELKNLTVHAKFHIACVNGRNAKASGWVNDLQSDASAAQFGWVKRVRLGEMPLWKNHVKVEEDTANDGRRKDFGDKPIFGDASGYPYLCVWTFNHKNRHRNRTCT